MEMICKLFCVFMLPGFVLIEQGQYHSLTTSDKYAVVGSPFTFTCHGSGYPHIIWSMNKTEYKMERALNGECHFLGEHPKEYTFYCSDDINLLTIKSVKRSQQGTVWRCGDDAERSNEVKLEVKGHNLTTSDTYAVVGSRFTFTCRGDAFPLITWFVNNAEYSMNRGRTLGQCHVLTEHPKEYTFYCSIHINTLTITSVNLSQQGTVWRCGVYIPDSNEVKLEVRDQNNTHNREGLAIGIPVAVLVVVFVVVFVVIWFRKVKSNHKVDEIYYHPAPDKGNDAPPEGDTDAYSSLMEQKNEETYVNINSDNQSENNSETN